MLLKEFYDGNNMIVVDFGTNSGSLLEEVGPEKVSDFLRNSAGGGSAIVDGEYLKSCTSGVTYGKFFKRIENAVSLKCSNSFSELREKYKMVASLQYFNEKHFVYDITIREIDFRDAQVVLADEAEKYRDEIENVLSEKKWFLRITIDAKPDERMLEESDRGYISADNIRAKDINTVHFKIMIK